MATQQELMGILERSAHRSEDTADAEREVLVSEGEKDVTLSDGTVTPNLNKRIKLLGSQVTSVVGKKGDITISDISEKLELGSASKYDVADLPISAAQKEKNSIYDSEHVNILSVYGGVADFGVAIEMAHAKARSIGLSSVFIPTGIYTAKTTAKITLDSNFGLNFGDDVTVNVVNEIDVFDIAQRSYMLSIGGNDVFFLPRWRGNPNNTNSILKLESRTLSKSAIIKDINTLVVGGVQFKHGINAIGLNYSLIEGCLFQAVDPIINASVTAGAGRSMGSKIKDCFLMADGDAGTCTTLINNGEYACEGWTIEGGEHFADTGIKVVNNLVSSSYYSPLLRLSNMHMNTTRFVSLEGISRVQIDGCDLQAKVIKNNPYAGLFEFTGVQAITIGSGTTITGAETTGVSPQDNISIIAFKNSKKGQISAFASIDGAKIWLNQNAPLVHFESASSYYGRVNTGVFDTLAFTGGFVNTGFESKIKMLDSTQLGNSNIGDGLNSGNSCTYDPVSGFLNLNSAPAIGSIYKVPNSVMPNGSKLNRIIVDGDIGKSFTVVFDSTDLELVHNANLMLTGGANIKTAAPSTMQFFSFNSVWCYLLNTTERTTYSVMISAPESSGVSGLVGQKAFIDGFVYEYVSGLDGWKGWVRYAAATF